MTLTITTIYTALFAIMIIPLSLQVTLRRITVGSIASGDGNDKELILKRETLRNFIEYVPLGLILLAVYEFHFPNSLSVQIFGGMFLLSRVWHVIGFQFVGSPKYFAPAMMIQHSYFSLASVIILYSLI